MQAVRRHIVGRMVLHTGIRAATVTMILLCSLLGAAVVQAQQTVILSTPAGRSPVVSPGKVFTSVISLRNVGPDTVRTSLRGTYPPGWSPIVDLPSVSMAPGESTSRLVALQVPPTAPAGSAEVSFVAVTGDLVLSTALVVPAEVAAQRSVVVSELERPDAIRTGLPVRHTYSITNSGNAPTSAVVSARSSTGYPVSIDRSLLRLDRGETGVIQIYVHPRADLAAPLTHRLVVEVVALDPAADKLDGAAVDPAVGAEDALARPIASGDPSGVQAIAPVRISTPVEILPIHVPVRREAATGLPLDLTFGASTEQGRTAGQLEAEVRPTTVGDLRIEALVRTPDVRRASSFGRQDRYAAVVSAEPGEIRLGDHVWHSTDLLEIGQYGFGAGAEMHEGRWSAGAHAMRSRHLFPVREQYSVFGAFQLDERLGFELHSIARKRHEAGVAGSALAIARPVPAVKLEAELAAGRSGDASTPDEGGDGVASGLSGGVSSIGSGGVGGIGSGGASGRVGGIGSGGASGGHTAWALRATGTHGRSSWSTRFRSAGANFPGSVRDTETLTGAANVFPVDPLRVQFQGRRQTRHFEPIGGARVKQTTSVWRAGAGPIVRSGETGLSGMIYTAVRSQTNGLLGLSRRERSLEAEAIVIRARTSVRTSLRRGTTDLPTVDALANDREKATFTAADLTVAGGIGIWSASAQASITDGPTFFNPADQQRVAGSLSLVREGRSTRASATIYHSVDTRIGNRSFTTADARVSRRFIHGVDVGIRARHVSASSARSLRDATLGIEVGVPLDVPLPRSTGPSMLNGRIVDAETGAGLDGVLLRLGSDVAETDESGRFSLKMPASVAYLNIDRPSIGLDRVPVSAFPMRIDPSLPTGVTVDGGAIDDVGQGGSGPALELEIHVIRSAALGVEIRIGEQERDRVVPETTPMSAAEKAGILIEARLMRTQDGLGAEDVPRSLRLRRRLLGRSSGMELADLLPGEWVLKIVPETLPSGWESRPDSVVVTLAPGSSMNRTIDVVPKRRTIRMVSSGSVGRVSIGNAAGNLNAGGSADPDSSSAVAAAVDPDSSSAAAAVPDTTITSAPATSEQTWPMEYEIREDDMLSTIAARVYGSPRKWVRIWLANRDRLDAPDDLDPGNLLLIPSGDPPLTPDEMEVLRTSGQTASRR